MLGNAAEETATHELLRDRGPTLREERGAAELVVTAAPYESPDQHAESDSPEHARQTQIIDAVVGEEALVLGGQDRVTDDRWNVLVPRDLALLPGQLDKRPVAGIVDVADGRELEAREGSEVRQVVAVEVHVADLGGRQQDRAGRYRRDDTPTEKGDVLHVHPHGGPRF